MIQGWKIACLTAPYPVLSKDFNKAWCLVHSCNFGSKEVEVGELTALEASPGYRVRARPDRGAQQALA